MLKRLGEFFALFASTSTLFCCAIPALLSIIAGGAAGTSFVASLPWITPLVAYKKWMFLFAGIMISINGFLIYGPKRQTACDISGGDGCRVAGKIFKSHVLDYPYAMLGRFFYILPVASDLKVL